MVSQSPFFAYAFSLLITCFITCAISGLYLFFVAQRRVNAELKHPYLQHRAFEQYPFTIKAAIFLDYFLRLGFPRTKFWIFGHANQQLAHVNPKDVPLAVKWPLVGFWGACWLGLIAMIAVWSMLLLGS
ncbi:hypothetical protein [Bordetella genomosp. 1]|uniref:Uncharacterized protein n=1 Tax=Bordetella genomosp. 1 TaxID=1395607 RepID=A0ABX4EV74_9BORD|nr:hypothetical protein [Bordetella genomosp. 1]MDQ8030531.1 hypothetical protein [Bordetella sp.]OZI58102.1 hypothetical protein CAL27_22275 [Bordetella genomosp. 1]